MRRVTWVAGLTFIQMVVSSLFAGLSFSDGSPALVESSKPTLKPDKVIRGSDWSTYRNEKYGFELKHPETWSVRSDTDPIAGQRWLEEVIIKNSPFNKTEITLNQHKDIYIRIYRTDEDRNENLLIKNMSTDEYHFGYHFGDSCLASNAAVNLLKGIPFSEIIISDSNRTCFFSGAYFFSREKNGYIYNIVPVPLRGIDYVGYDGKKMVTETFPEFYDILSTFKFTK